MPEVSLYWNNICVLHKGELTYLEKYRKELMEEDIDLDLHCFGLGYPEHLSDYLRHEDAVLPDIIVTADLEVFQDERIYSRLAPELYPVLSWYDLKSGEGVPSVIRKDTMLPYLIIPLVFYTKDKAIPSDLSLERVAGESLPIAFGGIDNSAGKSVVKAVWDRYGKQSAEALFGNALVTGMPIASFQAARTGVKPLALCPSIFAVNDSEGRVIIPSDGAVAVPSYIAVRRSIPVETARKVIDKLFSPEFLSFYTERGKLIACKDGAPEQELFKEGEVHFQHPSDDFGRKVPSPEFYSFYCSHIPSAARHL